MSNGRRWVETAELRVGLGCMRLPADGDVASDTIAAAAAAGITIFDTAHAYGGDDASAGQNEKLLARSLGSCGAGARIVTKGGMTRVGTAWIPDGRAKAIQADCEASLDALDGMAIDLYLLHAPDQRTTWRTSVRALGRLLDERLVAHVGLSNVTRPQLEEAVDLVDVTAIEVALSAFGRHSGAVRPPRVLRRARHRGDRPLTFGGPATSGCAGAAIGPGGRCTRTRCHSARGRACMVARHLPRWSSRSPVRRDRKLRARPPGRRRSISRMTSERLSRPHSAGNRALGREFPGGDADVVLVMGVPGAGKSRHAEEFLARGYARLNRDERGGSLRQLSDALGDALASGERRVVLDNTYLTRAVRSHVIEQAARHGVAVRCVWIDTPLAQAQVNWSASHRSVRRTSRTRADSGGGTHGTRSLTPTRQMRAFRELEPPTTARDLPP